MSGSGDVFGTAISGLMAFQRALHTTSQNISNAATEGYSRQTTEFMTRAPTRVGTNSIGAGVEVASVRRQFDGVVESRLNGYSSTYNYQDAINEYATQLDELLANASASLGNSVQNFFDSAQTVANTPTSIAGREVMVSEGDELVNRFSMLSGQLSSYKEQINNDIRLAVGELNGYAQSIAELNDQISQAGGVHGQFPPNDLMDKRDLLVGKMSELANINTLTKDDGSMDVFIGKGQPLVLNTNANNIVTQGNRYNSYDLEVAFDNGNGNVFDITNTLNGGKIGGLLQVRSDLITQAENTMGRMAVGLADSFNAQHRQGMDLDGDINNGFFSTPTAEVYVSRLNTGSANTSATITDVSQLTTSDYELKFNGTNYTLRDMETGVSSTIPGVGTYDTGFGFELNISAGAVAGDSFYIRPTGTAAGQISSTITDGKDIAAASAVATESRWDNQGDGVPSALNVQDISNAALLNDVTIAFTAGNQFDVLDNTTGTVLASNVAYNSGDSVAYNGWELVLSGTPATGDTFTVASNFGASGDNTNMLALAGIQQQNVLANGSESLQDSYSRLVSDIGVAAARSDQTRQAQGIMLQQAEMQKSSVSGVNLDEEAANLMRYQQAYAAAAKVMSTANTVFETLLNAVR